MARYSSFSCEDLVKTCAGSRNPAAWEEFIRRFQPVISKVVIRTARHWGDPSPQLLDDLIQETYVKICDDNSRLLRSFKARHSESFFGFLKTIAANVVRDYFKAAGAEKRGIERTEPLLDQHCTTHQDGNSLGALDRNILLQQIDEILLVVANGEDHQRNRSIFWLHHRQGLSASAIASLPDIGLSTKGVETTLRRMTLMIRAHLLAGGGGRNTAAAGAKDFVVQNRFK